MLIVALSLFLILSLPFILLSINKVQNVVVDYLTDFVGEKTGAKLDIKHVSLSFFNTVNIDSVRFYSPNDEKIAVIPHIHTHVSLLELLKGNVKVSRLDIFDPEFCLQKDSLGVLNIQFLIDILNTGQEISLPDMSIKLSIVNGKLEYVDKAGNYTDIQPDIMNFANLSVNNINTGVVFDYVGDSIINLTLSYLNCNERSGFVLENITAKLNKNTDSFSIPYFKIKLPESKFEIDSCHIDLQRKEGKIDWKNTDLSVMIPQSFFTPKDIKQIVPAFKNANVPIIFSSLLSGNSSFLKLDNLDVQYGDVITVKTKLDVTNPADLHNAFFNCNIDKVKFDKASLQDLIANMSGKAFVLPEEIGRLGVCNYSGNISGFFSNLVLYGNLTSAIGHVKTDVALQVEDDFKTFFVNGKIGSSKLNLAKILPQSGLGTIAFNSNSKVKYNTDKSFFISTDINVNHFSYKGYTYHDVEVKGDIEPNSFFGKIFVHDQNCNLAFNGHVSNIDHYKQFDFEAEVADLALNKLHLSDKYPDMKISFKTVAAFEGDYWATMNGFASVDSLSIINGKKSFYNDKLILSAKNDSVSSAEITSDIITGRIDGNYHLAALPNHLLATVAHNMPVLDTILNIKPKDVSNNLTLKLEIQPLYSLLNVLDIDWYTTDKIEILGNYDKDIDDLNFTVSIPRITNGKSNFKNIYLQANADNGLNVSFNASALMKKDTLNMGVDFKAIDNVLYSNLIFYNTNQEKMLSGELKQRTNFYTTGENNDINITSYILPTELILQNKPWFVENSVFVSDLKSFSLDNFRVYSVDNQQIVINGTASDSPSDSLSIDLDRISLDYLSELIPDKSTVWFGGTITGDAVIAEVLKQPRINADVIAENFKFNYADLGTAHATCNFDLDSICLVFNGVVFDQEEDTNAVINGKYFITKDSLDLIGRANGLDVGFINYYIQDVFGTVAGNAYGDVHVYGITKSKQVAVDVAAFAQDASITVDFLKSTFFFSDSIFVNKNIIDFGTIDITDIEGHKGVVKGNIKHDYFKNMNLDILIDVDNMLVMNTTRKDMDSFYGKVYGTGTARIFGHEDNINITCKAENNAGTKLVMPIDYYYATENSFIVFKSDEIEEVQDTVFEVEDNETNVYLDLMFEINPDAELQIIIDSKAGDMLRASGSGNLRLTYDINADDMKLYGNVQIERGSYLFTFQNLLRKEFKIKEGSSLSFSGDPLAANIDIDGYYQLTADVAELLDDAVLSNTSRTSVPVQCLLNLSGVLTQPNVKFDINLPNSEEELNRAVHNTINTDEMMNRQIIGLLLLGKFLNPESMRSSNVFTQNELYSVVSSTLSSQLNNWVSQMFDNWGFGVNFRTSGEGDTRSNEYEFNFNYSPTSRLEINGNVGYRDDAMSSTKFIGDFDAEYKLIQSGKLRAKAYTHTNDYKEFKKGLTTQGIGIVYSESFNSIPELVESWKNNARKAKLERQKNRELRKQRKALKKEAKEKAKQEKQKAKQEEKQKSEKEE